MRAARVLVLGLLLAAARAPAAEPAKRDLAARDPSKPLDLDTVVALALEHDARLPTLRAGVDLARAERSSANAMPNPEARLAYQDSTSEQPLAVTEESEQYSAALRVYPPRPWQIRALSYRGEANVQAALAALRAAEHLTTVEARRLYRELQYLDQDLSAVEQLARVRGERQEALKALSAQGQATMQDALGAGVDHLDALAIQRDVRRARRAAARSLAAMIGDGDAQKLAVSPAGFGVMKADPAGLDAAKLEVFALENRADFASVQWQARRAWAEYRAAKGLRVPWFSFVQGGFSQESGAGDAESWSAQVGVDIPLFPDPQDNSEVKWAGYKQMRALEDETREQVLSEVRGALDALRDAADQMKEYERDTKPMIDALQDTLKDLRAESGLGSLSALDIEERMADASRSWLAARNAFEQSLLALEAALGAPLPSGTAARR